MKKYLLSILFFIPIFLLAQEAKPSVDKVFVGFVSAGLNASQIAGDGFAGYRKIGGTFGVGSFIMYTPSFSNSLELNYSMKGSQTTFSNSNPLTFRGYSFDYVEIPIQFNFHDQKVAIFHGGFSVARLIRSKVNSVNLQNILARDWEIGFTTGATFLIKERFGLNLKMTLSLNSILTSPDPASRARKNGWYNNALSFRFMYIFQ